MIRGKRWQLPGWLPNAPPLRGPQRHWSRASHDSGTSTVPIQSSNSNHNFRDLREVSTELFQPPERQTNFDHSKIVTIPSENSLQSDTLVPTPLKKAIICGRLCLVLFSRGLQGRCMFHSLLSVPYCRLITPYEPPTLCSS